MKRVILFTLALVLALSLCACHDRKEAEQTAAEPTAAPTPVPTPEPTPDPKEAITAAMETMAGVDNAHVQMTITIGVNASLREKQVVVPQTETETGADGTIEESHMKLEAQIDADFMRAPFILRGTMTLTVSEDGQDPLLDSEGVQFCVWEKDGKQVYAIAYGTGDDATWMGETAASSGLNIGEAFEAVTTKLFDAIADWAVQFTLVGEDTVNGEPVTVYEALLEGETLRKLIETYSDNDGEPIITFTDEALAEIPGIRFRIAIDADSRIVCDEVDAAEFVTAIFMRLFSAQGMPEGSDVFFDTMLIKMTSSDFNAVGPVEPPENVTFYDQSSLIPSIAVTPAEP